MKGSLEVGLVPGWFIQQLNKNPGSCQVHTYNPSIWKTKEVGCEFQASPGKESKTCLKSKETN
jgi:hypothetical protein